MSRILVTGADGYLGRAIVRALLARSEHQLVLWCHRRSEAAAAPEREAMLAWMPELADRAQWHCADLRDTDPFAGIDPRGITHVVHTAAVARFNITKEVAQEVNVEGTRRALEFAQRCPDLAHFVQLGSLYGAGTLDGDIAEERLPPSGFANHYEWSKREAEDLPHAHFPGLPASVLRVATVIADDNDGAVSRFNVVHNCLRLLYYGLLTVWPGDSAVPVYVVTRRFVAEAAATVALRVAPGGTYHVAPDVSTAIALGELLEIVHEAFLLDPWFRQARILKPLLGGQREFEALADGAQRFGGPVMQEAVASIRPFAPQLFSTKRFDNRRLLAAIGGWREPDSTTLVRNMAAYLVRTRWGLR